MAPSILPRVVDDNYSDQESTTSTSTPPPDDTKRRSWLSHLSSIETTATTTPCSHRSSFSSTFSAATTTTTITPHPHPHSQPNLFTSPKPHKANNPLWTSIRHLRHQIHSRGGREIGLEHFRLVKRVGSGDLGSVYLCQIRGGGGGSSGNSLYAMKVVDREALALRNKLGRADIERDILMMLDHPFLPTLYAEFDASHYSCLVMEFCPGGDLYSARLKQPTKRFSISTTKFYAAEVLLALEYLHMMGIIYRDLKPENILVREDGHIMLSDFDLCLKCNDVVPKLLLHKQQQHHPRFTSSTSLPPSPPPRQHEDFTPSCVGPLRPVLTSCFSLRRRRHYPSTTTITEYASSQKEEDDNLSSITTNHHHHHDSSSSSSTEESHSDYRSTTSSVTYHRWATEMIAEPHEARSKSFVGTHEYLAPEVISGQGHGSAVDWWTFGIFLYEMLFGVTPFKGENNERTLRNILKQPLTFPPSPPINKRGGSSNQHHYWRGEEDDEREVTEMEKVKDLIRKLLVKNPKKRIGCLKGSVEIKKHEFFNGVNWALIRSVRPPVVPSEKMMSNNLTHERKKMVVMNEQRNDDKDDDDVDQRKVAVMMMMKKKMPTTTTTSYNSTGTPRSLSGNSTPRFGSGLSFVLPKMLSRKERDQPYQIPFQYDTQQHRRHHRHHRRVLDHHHHLRRRNEDEQQQPPPNQHFEYF